MQYVWCWHDAHNVVRLQRWETKLSDSHELNVSHAALSFFVFLGEQSRSNSAHGPSNQACSVNGRLFHVLSVLRVLPYIDCVVCIDCVVLNEFVSLCCSGS